ncbi:MAG: NAD(P)-dependent glycerol-1-phosphate dehydrogenase [Candidatus Jordarchaeum sp.]|uniref:NAD(P)-dependent glycerol-1-phosphate dehydrogenase n=1 Tax=Candidatus Jordarchaeum sp. TaxID=2823881 RepID=UPI00404B3010
MKQQFSTNKKVPNPILIENGALKRVGEVCFGLGGSKRALIVSDPTVIKVTENKICKSLQESKIEYSIKLIEKATKETVEQVKKEIKKLKIEIILGVGGGGVIDVSKLSASQENIPFISIPTVASHDGIASPRAKINKVAPFSIEANGPVAIIADIDVVSKAPYRLTASGCGDLISKLTSVKDWELAHLRVNEKFNIEAANLARESGQNLIKNAKLVKKRTKKGYQKVTEALIKSGISMTLAGSSRPASGAEHMFSHKLDQIAPNSAYHGEQCGIGTIIMMYLHGGDWRKIVDTLKIVGAPTTAKDIHIDREIIIKAITEAKEIRNDRYTILNEIKIVPKVAEEVAIITGII